MAGRSVISANQMLSLMILFEFGTAIVVHIGLEASQAVWLAVCAAIPGALLLYGIYYYLFKQYPDLMISAYMRKIMGAYLALPLSLFIAGYFIYNAARNLREAGDLLVTSVYDETPVFIIHASMALVMIYVLGKGLEVFFRLAQIYIFVIIALVAVGFVAILFSGEVDVRNILPLSGGSWGEVLRAAYPSILLFPFGEIFCFTTVLPHLNDKKAAGRTGMIAILISGIVLALAHAMQIMVLGRSIYQRSTFSLLTTISIVDIADFLQRLDALVMLTLIICVFFKMSMYSYAASAILADLLRIPANGKLAPPVGIAVLFLSIFSAWSFPEHQEEGKVASMIMLFAVTIAIPVLLFAVHLARRWFRTI